jgi:indolepyruvate ferredoxin oxidoreductase beta subunit
VRRADLHTRVFGKGALPRTGEYQSDALLSGLAVFLSETRPKGLDADAIAARVGRMLAHKPGAAAAVGQLPPRPPTFCTGCPERPVFSAIKLMQRDLGPTHISADIGCHSFATFAPFSLGNSILGYGMSLASAAAVGPNLDRRPISVMGDGGFWHNGLITGVTSNLFNKGDGVLIIMQNGYTSATGQQFMPSSKMSRQGVVAGMDIEQTLRSLGVTWLRKVHSYGVAPMVKTLKEAMRTAERGLKVIIADGECQLARQRRVRAEDGEKLKRGKRVVRTRYGVDDEICTGDHSCIRLSGCPSLTVKPNPDPLRTDPVATVVESCVGCGLCGEVADAAVLCPSFYRVDIVQNPNAWDRLLFRTRSSVFRLLDGDAGAATNSSSRGEGAVAEVQDGRKVATSAPARLEGTRHSDGSVDESKVRPLTILIAALGGEGGGVLTNWIVGAAESVGFPVQSTSIPGVAQRTGATTYYVELVPRQRAPEDPQPVLALHPGIGDIDMMVATELMEAGRAVAAGFVTPERTLTITATSRSYVMDEKIAMDDGRYDSSRLAQAIKQHSRAHVLIDLDVIARRSGAMVNAVMLGAIAASQRLPIPAAAFEDAIRKDGKAIENNLRGFRAGLEAAQEIAAPQETTNRQRRFASPPSADLEGEIENLPVAARSIVTEGVRRLTAYQDLAYARLYLDRLAPIAAAEQRAATGGRLLRETARHLAVRMSYEDVIRVAQAKIDPSRRARIVADMGVKPNEPFTVTEFLKPGIEELCSLLPLGLAQKTLSFAERRGWLGRVFWGMHVNSASVSGFLRFWLLAKLRRWRPYTYRFHEEQREIERWLGLIDRAAELSTELALEVAECARLIKGYGDTHKRGTDNYRQIEQCVIHPALSGQIPLSQAVDAIASARTAALVDSECESLANCLADIESQSVQRVAAE